MATQQQPCSKADCEQPAEIFGFREGVKTKACLKHMLQEIGEGVPVYSISADTFIETTAQVPAYRERKARMESGKQHLKTLEARCDLEWAQGYHELTQSLTDTTTTMHKIAEELQRRAQDHYKQIKSQLKQRESNLERLVVDRDFQLSTEDAALCEAAPDEPVLRVELKDCKEQLARVLIAHFQMWPGESMEVEPAAASPAEEHQSQSEIPSSESESAPIVGQPRRLRHVTDAIPRAEENISKGKEAREAGQYAEALERLQRARELLVFQGFEEAELSLQLGLTLLHFGKREEAERELRRGLYPEFDPDFGLSVQVKVALAEFYFQAGQWQNTIQECESIAEDWRDSAPEAELLKTLFFLIHSHYRLNQKIQGDALEVHWTAKLADSAPSSLILFIQAEKLKAEKDLPKAKERFEEGLELSQQPNSYATVASKLSLGAIYEDLQQLESAVAQYRQACSLSAQHFPCSLVQADSLARLSSLDTENSAGNSRKKRRR